MRYSSFAPSFARKTGWGRKFSAKSHSGHRRQRARPRSLCASNRTLQTTQPSSPAHPATHTSSSARDSRDTPSLLQKDVESLGSTCAVCFDGQAVNGYVLAARAQEPSVGTADRWLATWRVQNQAVREAVARSVSPRCAAVPTDASRSVWSALKATSNSKVGRPANQRPGS